MKSGRSVEELDALIKEANAEVLQAQRKVCDLVEERRGARYGLQKGDHVVLTRDYGPPLEGIFHGWNSAYVADAALIAKLGKGGKPYARWQTEFISDWQGLKVIKRAEGGAE